jgi:hypothetical protein
MWHSLFLGNGVDAVAPKMKIQNAFYLAFVTTGAPLDMAMFSASDAATGTPGVTLYFSPTAAAFAKSASAAQCEKPAFKGLSLLAGDKRCWPILFPDEH